jgi:hypothetical protein
MMGAYKENFPTGSMIRSVNSEQLAEFARTWKFHHPLQPEQMKFADERLKLQGLRFITAVIGFTRCMECRVNGMSNALRRSNDLEVGFEGDMQWQLTS